MIIDTVIYIVQEKNTLREKQEYKTPKSLINPNLGGGGKIGHATQKFSEKCPYSHHNNTVLIKTNIPV